MIEIPKYPTEETRLKAALETAKDLAAFDPHLGDPLEIARDIAEHCTRGDGYEMARQLEIYCGWDCDMGIADVLDGHDGRLMKAHYDHLRAWRELHRVEPPFADGAAVWTRHGKGVVLKVCPSRPMSYRVRVGEREEARVLQLWWDDVKGVES